MAIFRGVGGSGDATGDAANQAVLASEFASLAELAATGAEEAKIAAEAAQASAETAQTAAETAETNAETAETNAETAQTAAETAQAAAESARNAAEGFKDDAETAATTAEGAALSATTSANAASSSASSASSSASSASSSASSASSSASDAASSASSAAASFDSFDDRYLGAKSSDPSLDNDGNALLTGALYFNTTTNAMKVYTGSAWVVFGGGEVVSDTSPQLGGALDTNNYSINFGDNDKATFGDSEDLWIYHDGGSSYVYDRGTGNLRIITNSTVSIDGASGGEFMAQFVTNGAVSLYYDNSKKIETTSTGVSVNGNAVISADSTSDALRITQVGTGNALVVEDNTNPDSTPLIVDASGRAVIGYTSALSVEDYAGLSRTPNLQAHGLGGSPSAAYLGSWSNSDTQPSQVIFGKSKSGTVGTNGVVASGTDIGAVVFSADDGTALIPSASILGEVDGTPSTNDMPGRLVFSTTADGAASTTERMRIDSAGNVGIGTSFPGDYRLNVINTGDSRGGMYVQANGADCWGLEIGVHTAASESDLVFTSNAVVGSQASLSFVAESTGYVRFMTGGTSHKTGTDGATEVARFTPNGLTFNGDNSADNALNDYEIGEWTPEIADANTGGNTGSIGTLSGAVYVKVGQLVNVQAYLTNINTTGMTGANQFYIRNLPFTARSVSGAVQMGHSPVFCSQTTFSGYLLAIVNDFTSYCRIQEFATGANPIALIVSDFTSGTADIAINLTYQTTA